MLRVSLAIVISLPAACCLEIAALHTVGTVSPSADLEPLEFASCNNHVDESLSVADYQEICRITTARPSVR